MSIKIILIPVLGRDFDRDCAETALQIARRTGAHLKIVHLRPDPASPLAYSGDAFMVAGEIVKAAAELGLAEAREARAGFEAWRNAAQVALADGPAPNGGAPTASWTERIGVARRLAREARLVDLVVLPAAIHRGGEWGTAFLETLLFETGRPCVVVPSSLGGQPLETVVVAWKNGLEAARAVGAALPLLELATDVAVFSVSEDDEKEAGEIVQYLAAHGCAARALAVPGGRTVGEQLLAAAREAGAGLVVMGAYSHSRLSEHIFGGVTLHVLRHAQMPVLFVH